MSTDFGQAAGDWIPVALAQNLPAATATPATVAATELALWRGASGAVHAWPDRCPHRGMRLSFGFVRGDDLTCLYHGWRFGSDGGCRAIPAHPDLEPPKTICVAAYPCVEKDGLIWTRLDDGGPEGGPPEIGRDAIPVRSLTIEAGPELVRENLIGSLQDFPLAGSSAPAAQAARVGRNLFSIAGSAAATEWERLFAALQPLSETRTTLHLLVVAPQTQNVPGLLLHISRWSERFRRTCEAQATQRRRESAHENH